MRLNRKVLLGLAALALFGLLFGGTAADAGAATTQAPHHFHRVSKRAIVSVVAEAGGSSLGERLKGARVRVYAVATKGQGRARRHLVGSGRTGSAGVDLVMLKTRRRPARLLVVASGGKLLGKRFGGSMKAPVRGAGPAFVSPLSSLVVAYQGAHRGLSLKGARRAVRRYYRIPGFFDFAGDLADRHLFDGRRFIHRSRSHGGFDRFVAYRAKHLNRKEAQGASVSEAASGGCWHEAALTTAGFAELMGFSGIPDAPTLPSCSGAAAARASSTATASGVVKSVLTLEVFGAAVGVASLIYGIVSGQSTGAELAAIKEQLNEIQAELTTIQADLGGLQVQVAQVNKDVLNGDASALSGDAVGTINEIKVANARTLVLLGEATQILCTKGQGCAKPAGTTNFGEALDIACDDETPECEAFYSELYVTSHRLQGGKPLKAVEGLGGWALGSAFQRAPATPGIVQFALENGAEGKPFFTTEDAASARLEWAYYTLYSVLAQSTYATVLSMSVGQPLPGATSKHPPALTVADVKSFTDEMNAPISNQIAAFPNMPDTGVIVTDESSTTHDPPYLFAQQVGAVASLAEYLNGKTYEVSPSAVSSGRIPATGGGSVSTNQTAGAAPLVLTPAAANGETWQILPTSGARRPPLPAISSAPFSDWRLSWSEATTGLPQWNGSTEKVERAQGGLKGPLPDLFAEIGSETGSRTAGQWMTAESGIESTLLTPGGTGYGSSTTPDSGIVAWKGASGTDSKEPGLSFTSCTPAGDEECLLPTWQAPQVNPYAQVYSTSAYNSGPNQLNTGLFDFNTGLVFDNQQGHKADPERGFYETLESNPSAFVNQYPNWARDTELRGVNFGGFLEALDGQSQNGLPASAYNSNGRPVLFAREQTANDCFWWNGTTTEASGGLGCLEVRNESGKILP
jgi:hypothetical protein